MGRPAQCGRHARQHGSGAGSAAHARNPLSHPNTTPPLSLPCRQPPPLRQEAACWCLGYVAGHTPDLARQAADAGALPLLVLCVQEPELALKRAAASALSDVAKHSPELAQAAVDAGAVAHLAPLVLSQDARLKRNACAALAQVARHGADLAEAVVEAEVFPRLLTCLKVRWGGALGARVGGWAAAARSRHQEARLGQRGMGGGSCSAPTHRLLAAAATYTRPLSTHIHPTPPTPTTTTSSTPTSSCARPPRRSCARSASTRRSSRS